MSENVSKKDKRGLAKKERGKGRLAMGKLDLVSWTRKKDPLFEVKGIERHLRMQEVRMGLKKSRKDENPLRG